MAAVRKKRASQPRCVETPRAGTVEAEVRNFLHSLLPQTSKLCVAFKLAQELHQELHEFSFSG